MIHHTLYGITVNLFKKMSGYVLGKLPPAFRKNWREFQKSWRELTFPGWGLQFLWILLELIYNIFLIPKPA